MKKLSIVLVALAVAALAQPALADPKGRGGKDSAGQGHGQGNSQGNGNGGDNGNGNGNGNATGNGNGNSQAAGGQGHKTVVIPDRDRQAVQTYYRQNGGAACPPGLAKKNNGCLPPGQAKKMWTMGQPLPGSIPYALLPGGLLSQLTPAPSGYQYVRVADDVLMMGTGTRMVVGALADLTAM